MDSNSPTPSTASKATTIPKTLPAVFREAASARLGMPAMAEDAVLATPARHNADVSNGSPRSVEERGPWGNPTPNPPPNYEVYVPFQGTMSQPVEASTPKDNGKNLKKRLPKKIDLTNSP